MKKIFHLNTSMKIFCASTIILFSFMACDDDPNPAPLPTELTEKSDVANDWYGLQLRFMLERNSTLNGFWFGHIGIGLYESVRNGIPGHVSLSGLISQMPAMPAVAPNTIYYWPESANAAMADMLRAFNAGLTAANTASIDSLENAYNLKLKPLATDAASFDRSQAYGRSIAKAIIDWYKLDNSNLGNAGYVPPVGPGLWQPTPPANANGVMPFIGTAKTFLTVHSTLTISAFPFAYSEDVSSDFYKMEKELYDINQALTQDQKNTALYWVDQGNGIGYTPPGHDFSIVKQAIEQKGSNLGVAAEAYAKAGIAERDGTIVTWRAKYQHNLLRPVSYIQKVIKSGWLPFIPTPPHPEYPAAHAALTGSVMQATARVLGETFPVTDKVYEFRSYPARTYTSLFAAAEEAGISRLYGGIHYRKSIEAGLTLAKIIGNNVGDLKLNP
ncbi:MAG: vanadium-dependent haloperoxidase [Chitinophagaceae bacterium]